MIIKTTGFDSLNEEDKKYSEILIDKELKKLEKRLKGISSFSFHVKEYEKEGKREKFSIHSKIIFDNKVIEAEAFDWDFKKTLHKVFDKLEQEIEHKFHLTSNRD